MLGNIVVVNIGIVDALDGTPEFIESIVVADIGIPLLDIEAASHVFGDFRNGEVAEVVGSFHFGACGDAVAVASTTALGDDE